MKPLHTREGGGIEGCPHCISCRHEMFTHNPRRYRSSERWACKTCHASCRKRYVRGKNSSRPNEDLDRRPCCVRCRCVMGSAGPGLFRCRTCQASASARALRCKPRLNVPRPTCPDCGKPKAVGGPAGRFDCTRCRATLRAVHKRPAAAAALLAQVTAALPGYLTPDEREDAAQSIMLDVLSGKLRPVVPAPDALRCYANEARGPMNDRFHFISLSAPTHDGREFGETLAA